MNTENIFSYNQAVARCGSDYRLKKAIASGALFSLGDGLYSYESYCPDFLKIMYQYPNAVYTGESAYYFHSLSDVIPDKNCLATRRNATRFSDSRVKQVFMTDKLFSIGKTEIIYQGYRLRVYDKERMLIELFRNKAKYTYEYYKELITSFRREIHRMDVAKIYEYLNSFSRRQAYIASLEDEVL